MNQATARSAEPISRRSSPSTHRIPALDGLRGLAILLVIGFHAYSRWPELVPWATVHADFPPFRYGYLGVQLFFLISGFVILMTLENSRSFLDFAWRRWLRLFPAMLIASLIVFVTADLLAERPQGLPRLIDLIPGLTFTEPFVLDKLLGAEVKSLEGAFWSLFVEVRFYIVFGIAFFLFGDRSVYVLVGLLVLGLVNSLLVQSLDGTAIKALNLFSSLAYLKYFGWFAIGAFLYNAWRERGTKYFYWSMALLPLAILANGDLEPGAVLTAALLYLVFVAALFNDWVGRFLSLRPFLFLGYISYPLYLIHENAMLALMVKVHQFFPGIPALASALPGVAVVIAVAWLITRYLEPVVRQLIVTAVARARGLFRLA